MSIVFFCQSCGARFEVAPGLAGKRGHCKKCGQVMEIPRAEQLASMAAMPALAMAGAATGSGGASADSVLRSGASHAALAPITVDRMPMGRARPSKKPDPLDDAEDSKPYALATPYREKSRGRVRRQDNVALNFWRRRVGSLQKIARKIHETAYLISVPFLVILLFGAVIGNRHVALMGAAAVVLLNIGRLVAGAANLTFAVLRDGANSKKIKKPLGRVIEPAVTIGLVVLAFTFIPWLSRGEAKGNVAGRIREGARDLKQDIKGEVNRHVDVDQLGERAQRKFEAIEEKAREVDVSKIGAQAQDKLEQLTSPSAGGGRE